MPYSTLIETVSFASPSFISIYAHVLNRGGQGVRSPLDGLQENLLRRG